MRPAPLVRPEGVLLFLCSNCIGYAASLALSGGGTLLLLYLFGFSGGR